MSSASRAAAPFWEADFSIDPILTEAEAPVLSKLKTQGASQPQIAQHLGVSLTTLNRILTEMAGAP